MKGRLTLLLTQWVEAQQETNKKLDTIAAILVSNQLLQECVDHAGNPRGPQDIADLVAGSFSAGRCLLGELDQRNKEYDYQKSEFFLDDPKPSDPSDSDLGTF